MDLGGLPRPGGDQGAGAGAAQIGGGAGNERGGLRGRRRRRQARAHRRQRTAEAGAHQHCGQRCGDGEHVAARHRQALIGGGAGERERALRHPQPVHPSALGRAPGGEAAGVAQRVGVVGEDIVVEAEHDLGLVEVELRPQRRAERQRGALALGVAGERLPLDPARLGERRGEAPPQRGQRRRGALLGEHREGGAAGRPQRREVRRREGGELVPARGQLAPALAAHHLRGAVGVVELEHHGLGEGAGRAEARGVERVALDLDRPPVVAGDQDAGGGAAELDRAGELLRHAGQPPLGLVGEGEDRLLGPAARGHAGHRQRRADHLEERAAGGGSEDLVRQVRELLLDQRPELGRVSEIVEAAPVRLCHARPLQR